MPDIDRVKRNENRLKSAASAVCALETALEGYRAALHEIEALRAYYETDWLTDAADDAADLFPPDLERGVLSEDSVFDLLASVAAVKETVFELFHE